MKISYEIPPEDECLKLLEEYEVLPNILEHSMQVKNVAILLIDNLKDETILNRKLVIAAALLHDIAKSISIKEGTHKHDFLGGTILRRLGHHDIAEIVESHVYFKKFKPTGRLEEREIVHYADKRVMHNKIVSVEARIEDIIKRYNITGSNIEKVNFHKDLIFAIEKKIRSHLKSDIEDILSKL